MTIDVKPRILPSLDRITRTSPGILRTYTLKRKNAADMAAGHTFKNPYASV